MSKVSEAKVADLIPDNLNFNKGTEYGNALLEKSFQKFGAGRSILLDKNNRIIAGNKAAGKYGELGGEKVIVVETEGDTLVAVKRTDVDLDSQAGRELALADNATQRADLEWEREAIKAAEKEWGINAEDWGVKDEEWETPAGEAKEDGFNADAENIETRCKLGDIWQLGEHRLMCGDSTNADDVAKLMNGEKADLLLTDPPYNVDYSDKNEFLNRVGNGIRLTDPIQGDNFATDEDCGKNLWKPAFENALAVAGEYCSLYVTMPQGGAHMMMMMMMIQEAGWQVKHELIWVKNNHVLGRADYNYKHEPILYGWGKKHRFEGKGEFKTSVWEIPKPTNSDLHPTMKPVPLFAEMMMNSSRANDIVLDLFGGSGTTLIAAEQLGRKSRLMELDPHYCDVIITRWEQFTGKTAVRL